MSLTLHTATLVNQSDDARHDGTRQEDEHPWGVKSARRDGCQTKQGRNHEEGHSQLVTPHLQNQIRSAP